ncbi:MAG: DNA-3-methyladenine glycosylase I [Thermoanaerobaculia bacterium]|nr:DNA-3-methyladenine glycosylase I [Thermoanaerobaculia bacterium]
MLRYHDEEWGVPVRDGRELWAKLILDGAQAGLSWKTILHKREGYFRAFDGLDPERVAEYDESDVERLRNDPGIVRNRAKIRSAIRNARAWVAMAEEGIDFGEFLWEFVDGEPIRNRFRSLDEIPARTELSETISRELKDREFSFVGPTIVYAFMQAVGMVNDHVVGCFRHDQL